MYVIQHCFVCRPSESTLSEDAGIEPRTVVTLAMTAKCSSHTRLDRIQFLARSQPHNARFIQNIIVYGFFAHGKLKQSNSSVFNVANILTEKKLTFSLTIIFSANLLTE
jgi:hypothetical protein